MGEKKYAEYKMHAHIMHQNESGKCYCRAANALLEVDKTPCAYCPLWNGEARQPCCVYHDFDGANDLSPSSSKKRVARLISAGVVKEFPDFIGEFRITAHHWRKNAAIYERALQFAAKAHKGACRKGTSIPYIVHPVETSMIVFGMLWEETESPLHERDYAVMAAAALHDVIEDTRFTIDDLRTVFGPYTAGLVYSESENKRRDMPPADTWKVRKEEFLHALHTASRESKLIALGDKLSNMRSSARDYAKEGDAFFLRFNQTDKKMQEWYYRSFAEELKEFRDRNAYKEFIWLCDKVFG